MTYIHVHVCVYMYHMMDPIYVKPGAHKRCEAAFQHLWAPGQTHW